MCAALHKDADEKAISAMAAALISIGARVGSSLNAGTPRSVVIEGSEKTIVLRQVDNSALIATAPSDAKIGLIDFEMDKAVTSIRDIL